MKPGLNRMQLSLMVLLVAIVSLSSSIFLVGDLAFVRKRLGSGGLCGCLRSLASAPALRPHFCFLSLRRLCLLSTGMVIHRDHCYVHRDLVWVEKLGCNTPLVTNSCLKEIVPAVDVVRSTECAPSKKQHMHNKPYKALTGKALSCCNCVCRYLALFPSCRCTKTDQL